MTDREITDNHDPDPATKPPSPGKAQLAAPVNTGERLSSIDALRGLAVLGILYINIEFFALPDAVMFTPDLAGGFTGLDLWTWQAGQLFFFQKMMAIFSMLFGAGLVLMFDRAETAGRAFGATYYRRVLWLLVLGLAHGYLLWHGDILFTYAFCGLFLYLFRRKKPRTLIIVGIAVMVFGILIQVGAGFMNGMVRDEAARAAEAQAAGETLTPFQVEMSKTWDEIKPMFEPNAETVEREIQAYRQGYIGVVKHRAPMTLVMQTQALIFMVIWRVAGLMLLGMGLMKLGFFSASRSTRCYVITAALGFTVGLGLVVYGMIDMERHDRDFIYRFMIGGHFNYVGSILMALAMASVVMIVYQAGVLKRLLARFAAVGRMALTNYLMQTILCTTIFYGYGFGLFGSLNRFHLLLIVLSIWILQLIVSPLWLNRFRFGPAEWLWRTLTYWRRQPMRIKAGTV